MRGLEPPRGSWGSGGRSGVVAGSGLAARFSDVWAPTQLPLLGVYGTCAINLPFPRENFGGRVLRPVFSKPCLPPGSGQFTGAEWTMALPTR
jgi:hypothetical protein